MAFSQNSSMLNKLSKSNFDNLIMKTQGNFWKSLRRPIVAMAPMANVTDAAFRRMFALVRSQANESVLRSSHPSKSSKKDASEEGCPAAGPDVFWTEFVSVEGLLSRGKANLLTDLWFTEAERPIVAQVFGGKPEQFELVAAMIKKLGFDGIDVNMGCPDRGVEKSGGGAALMKDPKLAKEIIRATKRGAGGLPVSVKTRIGYAKNQIAEWIPALLEENLAALTVHFRTRNEMSDVPAHWELAPEISGMRSRYSPETILLGNGDVATLADAREKCQATGFDGVMFGRAMFGNPWFFREGYVPMLEERLATMILHAELFEKLYLSDRSKKDGRMKNFDVMKKHFKAYVAGFDGSKGLRALLMKTKNAAEVKKTIEKFVR
jgi:tRNA-dihydrouridine synthase